MSVFHVAYLQTRSFGTNECALRRHRDGHLVLASYRADAHLQKNPTAVLLKCVCHNWVWLVAKKPPCSSLQPTHSQQHPHDTTSQTSRQFNLGFILYLVSPVSSHMPVMLVWVRCPGVSECMRLNIWLHCQWSSKSQQTSVFSPHSSTISHLCLLPPPDVFKHSSWVLAFSCLVFPTIFLCTFF